MTGRERLSCILKQQPIGRLAWTTLVDDRTRSIMPEEIRRLPVLDFYRHISCDIFCFGNYGLPPELQVAECSRRIQPHTQEAIETVGGRSIHKLATPWGTLTSEFRDDHPVRHPVETIDQLRILHKIWAHMEVMPADEKEHRASFTRLEEALGDDGIFLPSFPPSPLQHLLEYDVGLQNFYELLADFPEEVAELLDTMMHVYRQEWEITAGMTPALGAISVENTSTTMISPDIYERYGMGQVKEFIAIMGRHDKHAVVHMCGHIRNLLPHFRKIGMTILNATTPPPVGDCPFESVLDVMGEQTVIFPGMFDSTIFAKAQSDPHCLQAALDALYTPRLRRANFMLAFVADGLETAIGQFYAVRDWFDRQV